MPAADPTKNATISAARAAITNRANPSRCTTSAVTSSGVLSPSTRTAVPTTTDAAARVGSTMRTAKPPKVRPVAESTSRLVRFETGRRLDDALASWVVASSDGSDLAFRARTSCTTTGVNSTAVASRLIRTVIRIATADTTSTRRRESCARLPIAAPAAAEEAGVTRHLGQHEHRGEEREGGGEPVEGVPHRVERDEPGGDDEHRGGAGDPQVGHAAPRHQPEHRAEHDQAPRGPHGRALPLRRPLERRVR